MSIIRTKSRPIMCLMYSGALKTFLLGGIRLCIDCYMRCTRHGLVILCRICSPAKILRICFPTQKKTPTAPKNTRDRPIIHRPSNSDSIQFATGLRGETQFTAEQRNNPLEMVLERKDRGRLAIDNQAYDEFSTPQERQVMIRLGP
jgi:hypothetical protein